MANGKVISFAINVLKQSSGQSTTLACKGTKWKVKESAELLKFYHLGTLNICRKYNGKPSNSGQDISFKTKNVPLMLPLEVRSGDYRNPLGKINVCTNFDGSPSQSSLHVSVQTKGVHRLTLPSLQLLASLAKNIKPTILNCLILLLHSLLNTAERSCGSFWPAVLTDLRLSLYQMEGKGNSFLSAILVCSLII